MNPERQPFAPISGKLRITILLTCAAALLCSSAAMFAVQFHLLRSEYWKEMWTVANQSATSASVALLKKNPEAARRVLEMLKIKPAIVSARIVLEDGRVFAEVGESKGRGDFELPILSRAKTLGSLQIQTDFPGKVTKLLGLHAILFVAGVVIAFLVALPVSSRLLHSIFDPIKTLGETARQVAAQEDYSLRAEKAGEDEVGAFTDTFNSMLAQIQERDQELRREIAERSRAETEVRRIHEQLMETSRQAGMAEVATGVLHNVGNVLNSVNVSATLVAEKLDPDRVTNLVRAANLLRAQDAATMAEFLANDPKGKVLPLYLAEVSAQLAAERDAAVQELASLRRNIEHIKEIVATQQNHARIAGIVEPLHLAHSVEEALHMTAESLTQSGITVARDFDDVPAAMADRHQVLQIFVNLIRNAKESIDEASPSERTLTVSLRMKDAGYITATFTDTGGGIAGENLTRIFFHGFTTRQSGHGFGLHSAALAAQQMAGSLAAHSEGPGKGATFTLELPVATA